MPPIHWCRGEAKVGWAVIRLSVAMADLAVVAAPAVELVVAELVGAGWAEVASPEVGWVVGAAGPVLT